ncbi:MAG: hypothetical protein V4501_10925 [Pseudomonadota bacterium]
MLNSRSVTLSHDDESSGSGDNSLQRFSLTQQSTNGVVHEHSMNGFKHDGQPHHDQHHQNGIVIANATELTEESPLQVAEKLKLQAYLDKLNEHLTLLPADAITVAPDLLSARPVDIKKLKTLFEHLIKLDKKNYNDKQILAVEHCKVLIMSLALNQLTTPIDYTPPTTPPATKLQIGSLVMLVLLGAVYAGAESFTGSYDLASTIFSTINLIVNTAPIVLGISVIFAVFSILLFFALEARGFMDEIGIISPFNVLEIFKINQQKLDYTKIFRQSLSDPKANLISTRNLQLYKDNFEILKLFEQDIQNDYTMMENPNTFFHNSILPIVKVILSVAGAGLFGCTGIIIGKDLIANLALIGTVLSVPAAIAVTVTLAVAGCALYYALQHRGVSNLVDALSGKPKDLLDQQKAFCDEIGPTNRSIDNGISLIETRRELRQVKGVLEPTKPLVTDTRLTPLNNWTPNTAGNSVRLFKSPPQPTPDSQTVIKDNRQRAFSQP